MGDGEGICYQVLTGCLFGASGLGLMTFGLMCLVSGNFVGATVLAFGTLCLSFGVFVARTVCNVNFYSVEFHEDKEFDTTMEMTVVSSLGMPIGRIQPWVATGL